MNKSDDTLNEFIAQPDYSVASLLHTAEFDEAKNDFYIDLVSGILSKNE